jgi:hypothetical protein
MVFFCLITFHRFYSYRTTRVSNSICSPSFRFSVLGLWISWIHIIQGDILPANSMKPAAVPRVKALNYKLSIINSFKRYPSPCPYSSCFQVFYYFNLTRSYVYLIGFVFCGSYNPCYGNQDMLKMQLISARKRSFRKKIPNKLPKDNLVFVLTTKRIKILCNNSLLCMVVNCC